MNHRYAWLLSLIDLDLCPIITTIDICKWFESAKLETYYIRHYKDLGYRLVNSTDGGEGTLNCKRSEETINKLIKSLSEHSKPVYQYDTEGNFLQEWVSPAASARAYNISPSKIVACRNLKRMHCLNYIWLGFKNENPAFILNTVNAIKKVPNYFHESSAKAVVQLSMEGEFIAKYRSCREACIKLNKPTCNAGNISNVCKGVKSSLFGFKWVYYSELENNEIEQY